MNTERETEIRELVETVHRGWVVSHPHPWTKADYAINQVLATEVPWLLARLEEVTAERDGAVGLLREWVRDGALWALTDHEALRSRTRVFLANQGVQRP